MVRKVWVCFDEDDYILNICDGDPDPDCLSKDCGQYVIKLIPVNRDIGELEEKADEFEKAVKEFDEVAKGFNRSTRRLKKSLDRYKI